jgi:hypothetical protein
VSFLLLLAGFCPISQTSPPSQIRRPQISGLLPKAPPRSEWVPSKSRTQRCCFPGSPHGLLPTLEEGSPKTSTRVCPDSSSHLHLTSVPRLRTSGAWGPPPPPGALHSGQHLQPPTGKAGWSLAVLWLPGPQGLGSGQSAWGVCVTGTPEFLKRQETSALRETEDVGMSKGCKIQKWKTLTVTPTTGLVTDMGLGCQAPGLPAHSV